MSKYNMCGAEVTAELEFGWLTGNVKRLRISYPDFRLVANLYSKGSRPYKHSISCFYDGNEIPLKADGLDYENEMLEDSSIAELFGWIDKNSVNEAAWDAVTEWDLRVLRSNLVAAYINTENYNNLAIPMDHLWGPRSINPAQIFYYEEKQAAIYHDPKTRIIILRFLGLNMHLMLCFGEPDEVAGKKPERTLVFKNKVQLPINLSQNRLNAIIDKIESAYFDEKNDTTKCPFFDWIYELYDLFWDALPAEVQAEKTVAARKINKTEVFAMIEKLFYAQSTPNLLRECFRNLPDDDRERILESFCDVVIDMRRTIRPGDIVLRENGERYLVISKDGSEVQTLTMQNGELCSDSFPLGELFPTGMRFENWENLGEDLAQYI